MDALEVLNAVDHGALRVSTVNDRERHFAQIVASEIVDAARDFAVLFTKYPDTGRLYLGVVMGLEAGRNLAVRDGALPGYRPADLVRSGFFLSDDVIAIDPNSPAFARTDGARLFGDDDQPTAALRRVQHALRILGDGLPATDAFIERLMQHRLIEPIDVSLDFDDGSNIRLDGLYTVSMDVLHGLPDADVLELFRSGDLRLAYAQAASLEHLRRLARRHNERLSDPIA